MRVRVRGARARGTCVVGWSVALRFGIVQVVLLCLLFLAALLRYTTPGTSVRGYPSQSGNETQPLLA